MKHKDSIEVLLDLKFTIEQWESHTNKQTNARIRFDFSLCALVPTTLKFIISANEQNFKHL